MLMSLGTMWNYVDDQSVPQKVFERTSNLTSSASAAPLLPPHVVNYQVSTSGKWCLLVSLTYSQSGEFVGEMLLFSIEKQVGQLLTGRSGTFNCMMVSGREHPIEVLCFEHKDSDGNSMIRIMEIGFDASQCPAGENVTAFKTEPIPLTNMTFDDFPVGMVVCPKDQILYIFTSKGLVFLIAIESGYLLLHQHIEMGTIFTCCSHEPGGVLYLTRNSSEVCHVGIDFDELSTLLEGKGMPQVIDTLRRTIPTDLMANSMTASVATASPTAPPSAIAATAAVNEEEKASNDWSQGEDMWSSEVASVFDEPFSSPPPLVPSVSSQSNFATSTVTPPGPRSAWVSGWSVCAAVDKKEVVVVVSTPSVEDLCYSIPDIFCLCLLIICHVLFVCWSLGG
jgi:hypothetical protein